MPKILIVLMGECHLDVMSISLARQKRKLLKQHKIPVYMGIENPSDVTFEIMKTELSRRIKDTEELIVLEKYMPERVFSHFLENVYFRTSNEYTYEKYTLNHLKSFLNLVLDLEDETHPDSFIRCIDHSRSEADKLADELEGAKSGKERNSILHKWSIPREKSMTDNLFSMIQTLKETGKGGVIIVSPIGELHVHRVAAYLSEKLSQESQPKELMIEIVATRAHQKDETHGKPTDQTSLSQESHRTQEYYKSHPLLELNYIPSEKNGFECKELDELFQRFINDYTANEIVKEKIVLFSGDRKQNAETSRREDAGDTKQMLEASAVTCSGKVLQYQETDVVMLGKDAIIKMAENLLGEQFKERYEKIGADRLWQFNATDPKNRTLTLDFIKLRDDTKKWFESTLSSVIHFVKFIEAGKDKRGKFYRLQFQNVDGLHSELKTSKQRIAP